MPEGRSARRPYFNWKKKYDGLTPLEMRRLKQLEDENTTLRKLVADLALDREMLQDVLPRKLPQSASRNPHDFRAEIAALPPAISGAASNSAIAPRNCSR